VVGRAFARAIPLALDHDPRAGSNRVGGAHASVARARSLDAGMQPAPLPAVQSAPAPTAIVYLCVAYSGQRFWSNSVCSQQRATIDRMTSVPGNLPFDQQVAIAAQAANEAAHLYAGEGAATAGAIGEPAKPAAECDALDQELLAIDAATRHPMSAQQMGFYRERRMWVQSRRAALHC
jgi:hypothetical protein